MTSEQQAALPPLDHLKDDEDFVAATAPERFLQERLNEARRQMLNARVACDECGETFYKLDEAPCGCFKVWPEVRYD
jgi:hypothetical protein